jgi:hypothetical protein
LVIYKSIIRMTNHLESVMGQDFMKTYFKLLTSFECVFNFTLFTYMIKTWDPKAVCGCIFVCF